VYFQHRDRTIDILSDKKQVNNPDETFLLDGVQFRHNLARELVTFTSDHCKFKWAYGHILTPLLLMCVATQSLTLWPM
jgi:hypothetical protein